MEQSHLMYPRGTCFINVNKTPRLQASSLMQCGYTLIAKGSRLFEFNPCLYTLAYGIFSAKVTCRLVVSFFPHLPDAHRLTDSLTNFPFEISNRSPIWLRASWHFSTPSMSVRCCCWWINILDTCSRSTCCSGLVWWVALLWALLVMFLDATAHICKRVRPSPRRSVPIYSSRRFLQFSNVGRPQMITARTWKLTIESTESVDM